MAFENGGNSIDDRDLDNDADFLQNRGYGSIRSMFLHNSDHPGMVLVTAPLTGSNYLTWSRSMKIALIAKQKLGFVNGKCIQPDMNSKEYEAWLRADSMVISWIPKILWIHSFIQTLQQNCGMNLVKDLESVMVPSFTRFKEK